VSFDPVEVALLVDQCAGLVATLATMARDVVPGPGGAADEPKL
jgi:hypothetical protein